MNFVPILSSVPILSKMKYYLRVNYNNVCKFLFKKELTINDKLKKNSGTVFFKTNLLRHELIRISIKKGNIADTNGMG